MKKFRFYIPPRCVVCEHHKNDFAWSQELIGDTDTPFTVEQIEDMVDLLRLESKPISFSGK